MSEFGVSNCSQTRGAGALGPATGASGVSASVAGAAIALWITSLGAQSVSYSSDLCEGTWCQQLESDQGCRHRTPVTSATGVGECLLQPLGWDQCVSWVQLLRVPARARQSVGAQCQQLENCGSQPWCWVPAAGGSVCIFHKPWMCACNLVANFQFGLTSKQEALGPVRGIRYSVGPMSVG